MCSYVVVNKKKWCRVDMSMTLDVKRLRVKNFGGTIYPLIKGKKERIK